MAGPWPRIWPNSGAAEAVSDDLTSIIRRRRMTRSFAGGPSTEELVDLCDVARRAPSAGFAQGSHFLVLDGADKDRFFETSGAGEWFAQRAPGVRDCSQVVLVLADPDAYTSRYAEADKVEFGLVQRESWSCPFWLTDAAMAAQNLLLLLEERRWGALLFGLYGPRQTSLDPFGIPPTIECVGVIAVGSRSPDDQPTGSATRRARRPAAEVIHRGSW